MTASKSEQWLFSPTTTLGEMVEAANHYNAGTIKMVFRNIHDTPIAAVIVIRGTWTQEVLDALKPFEPEEVEDSHKPSPDPETALQQIAAYLRTVRIEPARAVFDLADRNEPLGYWQTTDWLDGLLEIADAIDQRTAPEGGSDRLWPT